MAETTPVDVVQRQLALRRRVVDTELDPSNFPPNGPMDYVHDAIDSPPAQWVLKNPGLAGLAVGAVVLLGPGRIWRVAATGLAVVQTMLTGVSFWNRFKGRIGR